MAYLSDDELLDTEGGFTGWDAGAEETLEQALAEERLAELENELEQDEHPIDYEAELEDEEEEAAPVSDKRLKREIDVYKRQVFNRVLPAFAAGILPDCQALPPVLPAALFPALRPPE